MQFTTPHGPGRVWVEVNDKSVDEYHREKKWENQVITKSACECRRASVILIRTAITNLIIVISLQRYRSKDRQDIHCSIRLSLCHQQAISDRNSLIRRRQAGGHRCQWMRCCTSKCYWRISWLQRRRFDPQEHVQVLLIRTSKADR